MRDHLQTVRDRMITLGFTLDSNLFYYLDHGGQHSESFWGELSLATCARCCMCVCDVRMRVCLTYRRALPRSNDGSVPAGSPGADAVDDADVNSATRGQRVHGMEFGVADFVLWRQGLLKTAKSDLS